MLLAWMVANNLCFYLDHRSCCHQQVLTSRLLGACVFVSSYQHHFLSRTVSILPTAWAPVAINVATIGCWWGGDVSAQPWAVTSPTTSASTTTAFATVAAAYSTAANIVGFWLGIAVPSMAIAVTLAFTPEIDSISTSSSCNWRNNCWGKEPFRLDSSGTKIISGQSRLYTGEDKLCWNRIDGACGAAFTCRLQCGAVQRAGCNSMCGSFDPCARLDVGLGKLHQGQNGDQFIYLLPCPFIGPQQNISLQSSVSMLGPRVSLGLRKSGICLKFGMPKAKKQDCTMTKCTGIFLQ